MTIQINNPEIEQFITTQYGNNQTNLINDFLLFVKSEILSNELKKGFDEVEKFKQNKHKQPLTNAYDFLDELKNGN